MLLPPIIFEAGLRGPLSSSYEVSSMASSMALALFCHGPHHMRSLKTQLFVDNLGSILAFAIVLWLTFSTTAYPRWAPW